MRLMMNRFQQDGAAATPAEQARLTQKFGHAPRSYRDFATAASRQWQAH